MRYYGNYNDRDDMILKHWKYIKREKVNGKWRYYYDVDDLKKDVKKTIGIGTKDSVAKARAEYQATMKDVTMYGKSSSKKAQEAKKEYEAAKAMSDHVRKYGRGEGRTEEFDKATIDAGVKYQNAQRKVVRKKDMVAKYAPELAKANKEHRQSIAGRAETAGKAVKEAYNDTKEYVGKQAKKASDWTTKTLSSAKKEASKQIDRASDWLDGLFGKKKKKSTRRPLKNG